MYCDLIVKPGVSSKRQSTRTGNIIHRSCENLKNAQNFERNVMAALAINEPANFADRTYCKPVIINIR